MREPLFTSSFAAQISMVAPSVLRRFEPRLSEPCPAPLPVQTALPSTRFTFDPIFDALDEPTESLRLSLKLQRCVSATEGAVTAVPSLRSRPWMLPDLALEAVPAMQGVTSASTLAELPLFVAVKE